MGANHFESSGRIAVIGAGIVGACIAYELRRRGAAVVLIDRDEPGRSCSLGNSGAISPASVTPVAMPGILKSVPSMLIDPEGPLRIVPGYLPRALPWLIRFAASSGNNRVLHIAAQLKRLHEGAIERHERLTHRVGVPELFVRRGHLHLYRNEQSIDEDLGWVLRSRFGFKFERLDRSGLLELEPRIGARYQAAVFLADHATIINPLRYTEAIVSAFCASGGVLLKREVTTIETRTGKWTVRSTDGSDGGIFEHVVIAAGAWSKRLLDPLGIRVHLESQRGYHLEFPSARALVSRTVILADRKVFITPMEGGLRIGGTVEIAGLDRPPDPRRHRALARIASEAFDGNEEQAKLDFRSASGWMGHRPCMHDSVPVIGPAEGTPGLWLAIGHGHLGLTNSATTGELIAKGILGKD
jgi:D-amino-acid dehydrogenase